MCNFSRLHHEEPFCEIILNFGPLLQEELCLKEKILKMLKNNNDILDAVVIGILLITHEPLALVS